MDKWKRMTTVTMAANKYTTGLARVPGILVGVQVHPRGSLWIRVGGSRLRGVSGGQKIVSSACNLPWSSRRSCVNNCIHSDLEVLPSLLHLLVRNLVHNLKVEDLKMPLSGNLGIHLLIIDWSLSVAKNWFPACLWNLLCLIPLTGSHWSSGVYIEPYSPNNYIVCCIPSYNLISYYAYSYAGSLPCYQDDSTRILFMDFIMPTLNSQAAEIPLYIDKACSLKRAASKTLRYRLLWGYSVILNIV